MYLIFTFYFKIWQNACSEKNKYLFSRQSSFIRKCLKIYLRLEALLYTITFSAQLLWLSLTLQHADVHGVISTFRHTEHHLQTILYFSFPFLTARQQLLFTNTFAPTHTEKQTHPFSVANWFISGKDCTKPLSLHLQQKLVFGDSLNGFDQVRWDWIGQSMSPLYLLWETA